MAHHPINHPARPAYRALAGLVGLYLVIFGVLGVVQGAGNDFFAQDDTRVLGQGANLGSAVILGALGLLVLIGVGIGRNVDVVINKWLGYGFIVLGLAALTVEQTSVNYLNFSAITCIVAMVVGLLLLAAGMYGKVGTEEEVRAWQESRLLT